MLLSQPDDSGVHVGAEAGCVIFVSTAPKMAQQVVNSDGATLFAQYHSIARFKTPDNHLFP